MAPIKASIPVRVRYGETDQMGIVHHVQYLNYFEVARTELLRHCDLAYKKIESLGFLLVVTEAYCKYLKPAHYDDDLRVETWISRLSAVRIEFQYELFREQELLSKGWTLLACLSQKQTPTAIPECFKEPLLPYYWEISKNSKKGETSKKPESS